MNFRPSIGSIGVVSRRGFVKGVGAGAVLLGTGAVGEAAASTPGPPDYPFRLGVASGDPLPDSVVLWTRLAVDPVAPDGSGGMPPRRFPVRWEVAEDERFRRVVKRGVATATPELGHSVHPEVWGLQPNREYYYRFRAGSEISPVGRTKTAPALGTRGGAVSFAIASCQHYAHGHYTALGHLAEEDLDVAFHLGDYIYESGAKGSIERPHLPAAEIVSLADYRVRYGQYKSDPNLLAAHAAVPWVVVPDDHEVENNWADEVPEESSDTEGRAFLARRAAALQAYYENLPLRASALPNGIDMQLYRQLSYGNLIDFNMLDTRQYRDDQAAGDGWEQAYPEAALDPNRTMMGWEQERWLLNNLARSSARWQVLGNQAPMAETDTVPGPGKEVHMDPWDGYVANRNRILQGALDRDVANLVVITGDRHKNYASDLLSDYNDPDSPVVGSEFVTTSVSSTGNGGDMHGGSDKPTDDGELMLAANPHMKFFNAQRGYVRCRVTPDQWRTDFRVVRTSPSRARRSAPERPTWWRTASPAPSATPNPALHVGGRGACRLVARHAGLNG